MPTQLASRPTTLSTGNPVSLTLYLVAWSGGWEDPSFQSFTSLAAAQETYDQWVTDAGDRSDRVTMVEQQVHADGTVVNRTVDQFCPAWQDNPDD